MRKVENIGSEEDIKQVLEPLVLVGNPEQC
jgi:hypothetical protein